MHIFIVECSYLVRRVTATSLHYGKLPVISMDEMFSLLRGAIDVRAKAILGMMYSCGLRVSASE